MTRTGKYSKLGRTLSVLVVSESWLKVYGCTFRGSNSVIYIFASLLKRDLLSFEYTVWVHLYVFRHFTQGEN